MNPFARFLTKYGVKTHSLAVAWASLVGLYFSDSGFQSAINQSALTAYHHMPPGIKEGAATFAAIAGPLWAWYRNGQKKTVVEADIAPGQNATVKADVSSTISNAPGEKNG
jgi:hypothetical protein